MNTLTTRLDSIDPDATSSTATKSLQATIKRQQIALDKLDPARRSMTVIGFHDTPPTTRHNMIKDFLHEHIPSATYELIDTVHKGPYNNRTPTPLSYVQFTSTTLRDHVLKFLTDNNHSLKHNDKTMRLDKMKPQLQLNRNYALKKAKELIEKHPDGNNKTIIIHWKNDNTTTRTITVNDVTAFTQTKDETTGTFSAPFNNITIN